MEEKDDLKGYKRNKITLLISVIRYIIGLLFLFAGIIVCLFTDEIIPGVYAILIGIVSTPIIAAAIEKKINVSHKITLLVGVIRFIIGLFFLLAAMGGLFKGEILQGVISILIGIILIPVIADLIEKKMNLSVSLSLRLFIVLCLFYAIGMTVDPVDPVVDSGAESNIATAPQQVEATSIRSYQNEKWLVTAGRNAPVIADDMPIPQVSGNELILY